MSALLAHGLLWLLTVGVLAVVGAARATRLWTHDTWPPVVWLRDRFLQWAEQVRWYDHTGKRLTDADRDPQVTTAGRARMTWRAGWTPLATCPFCVAPWLTAGSLAWAWASGLEGPWGTGWLVLHVWFTVSYLASMVVVRDEPGDG